jgi:hypothetical protein
MRGVQVSYLIDYAEYIPQYLSHRGFGAAVLVRRYAALWRTQLEREGYKVLISSHSTSRRGTHDKTGEYLPLVFGTSGPVT